MRTFFGDTTAMRFLLIGVAIAMLAADAGAQTKPVLLKTPAQRTTAATRISIRRAAPPPLDQLTMSGNITGSWHYTLDTFRWELSGSPVATALKFLTDSTVPAAGDPAPNVVAVVLHVPGYPPKTGTYTTHPFDFTQVDVRIHKPQSFEQYLYLQDLQSYSGNGEVTLTITSSSLVGGVLVVHGTLDAQAAPNGYTTPTRNWEHIALRF